MKFFAFLFILCALGIMPLAAGGGAQAQRGAVADSAAIVTPPGQLPIVREPITLTLGFNQSPNVSDYKNTWLTQYLERRTGINLEFQMFAAAAADANTQFELMVSSGERLPDIRLAAPPNWAQHGDNGVFLDLNPLIENWAYFFNQRLAELSPQEADRVRMINSAASGRRYAFSGYDLNNIGIFSGFNWVNRTWLENLGIPMPTTTEEFYNTLVAFRDRDPNRNGLRDEIPWMGSINTFGFEGFAFLINAFVYYPFATQNESRLNATDGRLWAPWVTEEYREALRYISRLFNEGLITTSFFTAPQAEVVSVVSYQPGETGRVGFISGHHNQVLVPETPAVFDFMAQVSLTGPRGVNYYPKSFPVISPTAFITRDAAYPEAAFRWLDFLTEKDVTMSTRFGELGVDWRWIEPSEGLLSATGIPAVYMEMNMIWGVPQNKHWNHTPAWFPTFPTDARVRIEGSWATARGLIPAGVFINDNKDVSEKVGAIVYTRQEEDSIREIRTSINTYRDEAFALFVTGAMNIDRDWSTYLANLERMGLPRYLQVAQTAYTRTTRGN